MHNVQKQACFAQIVQVLRLLPKCLMI